MEVTLSGKNISVRVEQDPNAQSPILVTLAGIYI